MVRVPGSKSGNTEFKSHSDHQLDLFQVVSDSTPQLPLYMKQIVHKLNNNAKLGCIDHSSIFTFDKIQ